MNNRHVEDYPAPPRCTLLSGRDILGGKASVGRTDRQAVPSHAKRLSPASPDLPGRRTLGGMATKTERYAVRLTPVQLFVLGDAAWAEFLAILDRPVSAPKPRLVKLFAEPSIAG